MNHLLFGFAVCAALAIYPGGLAALAASLAGGAAQLFLTTRQNRSPITSLGRPWSSLMGIALAGFVLAPLPWPDNPVAPVEISWASGTEMGGVALSLAGIWGLVLLGSSQHRRGWAICSLGAWSLGIVLLSTAVGANSWEGILNAGGLGAELGRVGLAGLGLLTLPWALAGAPGGTSTRGLAWAAGTGAYLFLALPQLQSVLFPVALLAWAGLMAALGAAWAVGSRWGPILVRRVGRPASAATLNAP